MVHVLVEHGILMCNCACQQAQILDLPHPLLLPPLLLLLQVSAAHASMRGSRARLPAHGCRQQVLDAVASNDVVVISGATGCGKSTQVGRQRSQQ